MGQAQSAMTFLIAAAGTGGHVFPGLAVGEALVELGVGRGDVHFVGGSRLEAGIYPKEGFPFLEVELAGLRRSLTTANLRIPAIVARARRRIRSAMADEGIRVALAMGGYVTVPTVLAARSEGIPFFTAEQNAEAGLANRIASRWASRTFISFPETKGLPGGEWVGNPVRRMFREFDRPSLRDQARARFGLAAGVPTLGVFGGSLGAGVVNESVAAMLRHWEGRAMQVVHLTGQSQFDDMMGRSGKVSWVRRPFEDRMDLFYAASDLVIARAGGAVAELTATGTPAVLVPGRFGSSGHQSANARHLERAGAAVVMDEGDLGALGSQVDQVIFDPGRLEVMTAAAVAIAKPDAALTIARAMIEAAP